MLDDEVELADEAPFDEERFGQSDAGVEVQVGHRKGVFEHVPEAFLRVEEEEIGPPGEGASGQALGYGDLKLDVGVLACDALAHRTSEDEIVVLVESEVGAVVEGASDAVGVDLVVVDVDDLCACPEWKGSREECRG